MTTAAPAAGHLLRVEPSLAETAMTDLLARPDRVSEEDLAAHRVELESLYADVPLDGRDAAFGKLALAGFMRFGLAEPILRAIRERPSLVRAVRVVLLGTAAGRLEEGITCEPGGEHLGIRLEPGRLAERAALLGWARHVLGHAEDTLDPDFGFESSWEARVGRGSGAAVRARLHRLWDVSVDARLAASGHLERGPVFERHRAALAADLEGTDRSTVEAVVAHLWSGARPDFATLLSWAQEPLRLVRVVAPDEPGRPIPDRCPLCSFPSRDVLPPEKQVAELVQADYPTWQPELGLCGRCGDRYRLAALYAPRRAGAAALNGGS